MANPTFERMPRRFRQALVVLVVVGTLFNAWTAIDAQLALPDYTAKATSEVRAAAALNRTMMAWDIAGAKARAQDRQFQEYCRQSGTTHNDPACSKEELPTPDPTYSSEEAIQRTIRERADGHSDVHPAETRRDLGAGRQSGVCSSRGSRVRLVDPGSSERAATRVLIGYESTRLLTFC